MVHGLSLATITGRWFRETPFVQASKTWKRFIRDDAWRGRCSCSWALRAVSRLASWNTKQCKCALTEMGEMLIPRRHDIDLKCAKFIRADHKWLTAADSGCCNDRLASYWFTTLFSNCRYTGHQTSKIPISTIQNDSASKQMDGYYIWLARNLCAERWFKRVALDQCGSMSTAA